MKAGATSINGLHVLKRRKRGIIALTLTAIYLMIALAPLASLALHSKTIAHTVAGQCTGDCASCGCPAESSAARTCCCSMKKRLQAHNQEDGHNDSPVCCNKSATTEKVVIFSCGSPCGKGKQLGLVFPGNNELLPCCSAEHFTIPDTESCVSSLARLNASRDVPPPDPPPEIS
jgi:hypothetical protein